MHAADDHVSGFGIPATSTSKPYSLLGEWDTNITSITLVSRYPPDRAAHLLYQFRAIHDFVGGALEFANDILVTLCDLDFHRD